jgi:hypothetical protein
MSTKQERIEAFRKQLRTEVAQDLLRVDPVTGLAIVDVCDYDELVDYMKRAIESRVPIASSGAVFGKTN